jgi:hypothetical protein
MIPGKEVEIGGTRYTLPPLNVASLRKHKDLLNKVAAYGGGKAVPEVLDAVGMADVVFESLVRNYPQAERDRLEENMDTAKLVEAFVAVIASGLAAESGRANV